MNLLPEQTGSQNEASQQAEKRLSEVKESGRVRAWSPLSIPLYRSFWFAGLASHVGTWMHETGAQWLMTSLTDSPSMVSAVRTAMTIPVFTLALAAGVWADRLDRRTWLLTTQTLLLLIAGTMAVFSYLGLMTPFGLLIGTFAMGIGMVLNQPAWQALTPELVPAAMVPSAIQAGSVAFNLARTLGPAAAGFIIARGGVGTAFLLNALSFLAIIIVLLWKGAEIESNRSKSKPEFMSELKKGLFVIRNNVTIYNTLLRLAGFAFGASILWSLLSLIARNKLGYDEQGFGLCLALVGSGAVGGVFVLTWLREKYSSDIILIGSQTIYAVGSFVIGGTTNRVAILVSLVLIGAAWMTTMTTLNATMQVHLPRKFRARGMSAHLMVFALGMSIGSVVWGSLGTVLSTDRAFMIAGVCIFLIMVWSCRLPIGSLASSRLTNGES